MEMPYRNLRYWLLPLLRLRISKVRGLEHLPNNGPYLIASNHNAWLDTPLMVGAIYHQLQKMMFFIARSHHYVSLGALEIDQSNKAAVIATCLEKLKRGHVVAVYPEGISNPFPVLREAKTGIARLAHLTGLPVIPAGIRGTFGMSMPFSVVCFLAFWHRINFHFGEPVQFPKLPEHELTREQLSATTRTVMEAVSRLSGKSLVET